MSRPAWVRKGDWKRKQCWLLAAALLLFGLHLFFRPAPGHFTELVDNAIARQEAAAIRHAGQIRRARAERDSLARELARTRATTDTAASGTRVVIQELLTTIPIAWRPSMQAVADSFTRLEQAIAAERVQADITLAMAEARYEELAAEMARTDEQHRRDLQLARAAARAADARWSFGCLVVGLGVTGGVGATAGPPASAGPAASVGATAGCGLVYRFSLHGRY